MKSPLSDYSPGSPPTYHNHSKDYNAYSSTTSSGPKSSTTTKLVEANEEDTKGYHTSSNDGRVKTTFEERTNLKHMRENVTTATLIGEDGETIPYGKASTSTAGASKPVIATETRKMAYTEATKVGDGSCFSLPILITNLSICV